MSTSALTRRHILLGGAAALGLAAPFAASQAYAESAAAKVYVDPGHGGSDSGAVGHDLQEKDLTLAISTQLRDLLTEAGAEVRMSRDSDIERSLDYRTTDANDWGATVFVSVHINSGGGTGFESYRYTSASDETGKLHEALHPAVHSAMKGVGSVDDRGPKTANFHVLRETTMPAVLTENLFIDTEADAQLLANADFIKATAEGHAKGIKQYLGL